jgi:hypothetical protein
MVRYFGVLAGKHALRSRIVPDTPAHDDEPKQLALFSAKPMSHRPSAKGSTRLGAARTPIHRFVGAKPVRVIRIVAMTEILLLVGVMAAVLFVAVLLIEGTVRPGYDPAYHTGSELELGERGWIQRVSFFVMGAGVFAFAVAIQRILETMFAGALLAVFGCGMIVAGVFTPDPIRGYPPGAPTDPSAKPTRRAQIHHVVGGPIAFFAIFGACLTVADRLQGGWRTYTLVTAVLGLALTLATAASFYKDAAKTGLVQRGLILVYWSWIVALGIHLMTASPQP